MGLSLSFIVQVVFKCPTVPIALLAIMPVIYKPIEWDLDNLQGGCIAFCTTMGIAIKEGPPDSAAEVWREPSFHHPYFNPTFPGGCIAFCTTMGIVIREDQPDWVEEIRRETPIEYPHNHILPWNRVTTVHRSPGFGRVIQIVFDGRLVRTDSIYGLDSMDRIYMTGATDELEMAKPLQASIRRMLNKKRVERCTAAAMVLHCRLGDRSAMRVLSCQLMELIVSYV